MKEFKSFKEFKDNLYLVPEIVAFDIMVKINNYIMDGGKLEDEYVYEQLKVASQFTN